MHGGAREKGGGKGSKLRSSKGENFRYRAASDALPSERRDATRRPTVVRQTRHGCLETDRFSNSPALRARPSKDSRILAVLPRNLSAPSSFFPSDFPSCNLPFATGRTTSSPKPTRHNAVSVRSFFLHSSRLAFLLSLRCVVSVPLCGSWPRVAHRERHSSHVDRAELSFSRPRGRNRSLPVNDTSRVIVSFSVDVLYAIRWMSPFEQPFASRLENWQAKRTARCSSIERLVQRFRGFRIHSCQ